ncbi:MAG TPA: hypothetical protein VET90_02145, partial [Candidatus Binatus sp.]|nr:hypothetical protein [Candidatus Binatus sp.]
LGFTEREARRGRRFDGVILDPPSAGHARGRRWTLREDLPSVLEACAAVAADDAFLLLTAHSAGIEGEDLRSALEAAFPRRRGRTQVEPLILRSAGGARLELGWAVRLPGHSRGPRAQNAAP